MTRPFPCYLLMLLFITVLSPINGISQLYVSPKGNDAQVGTKDAPYLTLASALRKARELRRLNDPSITNGIHIIMEDGLYPLEEPVFIRREDAGTTASPTTIEAAPGAHPVLSGGVKINGWKKVTGKIPGLPTVANGKLWEADAPLVGGRLQEFRQLWVDDRKATRARDRNADRFIPQRR